MSPARRQQSRVANSPPTGEMCPPYPLARYSTPRVGEPTRPCSSLTRNRYSPTESLCHLSCTAVLAYQECTRSVTSNTADIASCADKGRQSRLVGGAGVCNGVGERLGQALRQAK